MRISKIVAKNIKRFTDLTIENIPESAKVVFLVGSNGSGKTSLFEAINVFFAKELGKGFDYNDDEYVLKNKDGDCINNSFVQMEFHSKNLFKIQKTSYDNFYFRSAYRNESSFLNNSLRTQNSPLENRSLETFIQNDVTVSANYKYIVSDSVNGFYDSTSGVKPSHPLYDPIIQDINNILNKIFTDLTLTSLGRPLEKGSFYFTKGIAKNFNYKNLSGGEKSVFDIILDLFVKIKHFPDAIYCIDEPEAHMHTSTQALLFQELYDLVPGNSQLWLATHSLGMLKTAMEIEKNNPESIVFINMDEVDMDQPSVLRPTSINKTIWNKFVELSLGEFANIIAPERVVFCESSINGKKRQNFDSQIYTKIFQNHYPETSFVSIGSCNDLEKNNEPNISVIKQLLTNSKIVKLVDKDDRSSIEIEDLKKEGIKVLKRRHVEAYLLDDELIIKLCKNCGKEDKIEEALKTKKLKIQESIARGNPIDDVKSAAGSISVELKNLLSLTSCGNTTEAFLRDTMAPLITDDTAVYKELEEVIFN